MSDRNDGAWMTRRDRQLCKLLSGKRFDDARPETWSRRRFAARGHTDTVVGNFQHPANVIPIPCIINHDLARSPIGKTMLERVDHEFGNDEPEANRPIGGHLAVVDFDADREPIGIFDHRRGDAGAKLG